jgi:hypothetical protein
VTFQTQQAGPLIVTRDGDLLMLGFPSRPPEPCPITQAFVSALGKRPSALLAATKYLAVYDTADDAANIDPAFSAVARLEKDGRRMPESTKIPPPARRIAR